jgi:hypothetical protein
MRKSLSLHLSLPRLLAAGGLLFLFGNTPVALAGNLVDVTVIHRSSGERLTPWRHDGKLYVVGTPGEPYAIELRNRSGERVLGVVSVDGVNVLSGETAAAGQSGYVLEVGRSAGISGWRKSMDDVARFVFTSLADSYAARTGRPEHVGVIGVAVFRERSAAPPVAEQSAPSEPSAPMAERRSEPGSAAKELSARDAVGAASSLSAAPASRLGTGHGERERAPTSWTRFERARAVADEVLVIHYDSRRNLIARGILRAPRAADPLPFPAGGGFVPDPRS